MIADVVYRQARHGREGGGMRRDNDGPTALGASTALATEAPFPFAGTQLAGTQLAPTPLDDVTATPLLAGEASAASMRFLEISLAFGAIATAVLIGLVH